MPYTDLDSILTPATGVSVPSTYFDAVRDNFELVAPWGAWSNFTPTVRFGATAASINNDSRWMRIGRLVIVEYSIRLTSLNGGTGTMSLTRPVAGRQSTNTNNYTATYGMGGLIDVSAGGLYHHFISANLSNGTDVVLRSPASPGVVYSNTSPVAVAAGASATGDEYYGRYTYEASADA